jgi:AcrR family transcriptional regulator
MKTETKNRILQRAAEIFFAEGFSVGIDRVTRECDTAKMTIYAEFKSKDGLICALLTEVRQTLTQRINEVVEPALPGHQRLQALFNLVCYGMNDPVLKIGLCVRALTEFPAANHPVHQAALDVDRAILKQLEADSPKEETRSPAAELLLLAKGCFLMAPLLGVRVARELALELAKAPLNRAGGSIPPLASTGGIHSVGGNTNH